MAEQMPCYFPQRRESYFCRSHRPWMGNRDAEEMYQNGIASSFLFWGLSEDDVNTYLGKPAAFPGGGSAEQHKSHHHSKMGKYDGTENIEAGPNGEEPVIPTSLHFENVCIGTNSRENSISDSEVTSNPNTPAQKTVSDKVWWDVNTTGQN
jgi:hypothetical protein